MKRILLLSAAALALGSCATEPGLPEKGAEAVFRVTGIEGEEWTRAAHNYAVGDYFGLGDGFDNVTVEYGGVTFDYVYDAQEGLLYGVSATDVIRFPQDGTSPLTGLVMRWPADDAAGGDQTDPDQVSRDQSTREKFLAMDRLEARADNVMPTTVISMTMRHARSKITFTAGGIHEGKRIESLEVGGFEAFCDPALPDAQLIYDQTRDAGSLALHTQGEAKLEGVAEPLKFMLAQSPDAALQSTPGNYTITLLFN
ncbi:MAG: fimbrillin family protein [Alistipes sp.]|nr:fimbrillin family protein [Alistipes sp.]